MPKTMAELNKEATEAFRAWQSSLDALANWAREHPGKPAPEAIHEEARRAELVYNKASEAIRDAMKEDEGGEGRTD